MVEINLAESIYSCNLIFLMSRLNVRRGIELTVASLHVVKPLNIFEDLTLSMLRVAEERNDIQQLRLKSREKLSAIALSEQSPTSLSRGDATG